MGFEEEVPFESRLKEASKIIEKYPDRIPVICERSPLTKSIPDIDRRKFLVPRDLTVAEFTYVIRRRIQLPHTTAMFVFIKKQSRLPPSSQTMRLVYEQNMSPDAFLYMYYTGENTFG